MQTVQKFKKVMYDCNHGQRTQTKTFMNAGYACFKKENLGAATKLPQDS